MYAVQPMRFSVAMILSLNIYIHIHQNVADYANANTNAKPTFKSALYETHKVGSNKYHLNNTFSIFIFIDV